MPEWKKKSVCDKRKASQLGPLTKASETYGCRAQMSTVGPGLWEKLSQKKSYWVMPTERRLFLQIACIS